MNEKGRKYNLILMAISIFGCVASLTWATLSGVDRAYLYAALLMLGFILVPFYVSFEKSRPYARRIVLVSCLIALAVVSRAAFFWIPQFKPIIAVVIISGIGLGARDGFVIGSMSAFVSNFLFGQGPWTPFQMVAWGLIGFFAGVLFHKSQQKISAKNEAEKVFAENDADIDPPKKNNNTDESKVGDNKNQNAIKDMEDINENKTELEYKINQANVSDNKEDPKEEQNKERLNKEGLSDKRRNIWVLTYGAASCFLIHGAITDIWTWLSISDKPNLGQLLVVYSAGIIPDIVLASATVLFLTLATNPMLKKIKRVETKYGL